MDKVKEASVAVIGLGMFDSEQGHIIETLLTIPGVVGLVAVKNLVEEGFDVTGFDRNDYVGGLWHYTEDDKTSVLPSKVAQGVLGSVY